MTAVAAMGLGVTGTATAAITPAAGATCTTEPLWKASTTAPTSAHLVQNYEYTVKLPYGTFYAEWSSAWNLAVKYVKTSGSAGNAGTFQVFDIYTVLNANGVATQTCGFGPGASTWTATTGDPQKSYIFSGDNQPPKPYSTITSNGGSEQEVIAVAFVDGEYYAIGFPG
jgi:hypothetical protein